MGKREKNKKKYKQTIFKILFGSLLLGIFISFSFGNFETIQVYNTALPEHNAANTIEDLKENGCIVLNYHKIQKTTPVSKAFNLFIQNNSTKYYTLNSDAFEKQMQYLHDNQIPVLSEHELKQHLEKKTIPAFCATITFDDVDSSVYDLAFPILKKYHFPFSVYQIIGHTGEYFKGYHLSSWEELNEMKDSGLGTIGLHTYDMHYIDSNENKPPFLIENNEEWFQEDLLQSIEVYRENMQADPTSFAYPFGLGNSNLDQILIKNNITLRYSLFPGVITQDFDLLNAKEEIPRYLVTNENFEIVETAFHLMKERIKTEEKEAA